MPEIHDIATLEALLEDCQSALGYRFRDREFLVICLTHASTARTRLHSNERMEFLGDAVLGMVVVESLYHRFPDASEGELTRIKSIVVSRATCASMAAKIRLEDFVFVGKGLGGQSGRIPSSILAGAFEGLVAAMFLDGGLDAVRRFLLPLVTPEIDSASASLHAQNFKSLLQHIAQTRLGATPNYRLLDEHGPDHSKIFQVSAVIAGRSFPAAIGNSKKEAEQLAAQYALEVLLSDEAVESAVRPNEASENLLATTVADFDPAASREASNPAPSLEPFGVGVDGTASDPSDQTTE